MFLITSRANDKQNVMELLELKDENENSEVGKERKESVAIFNNQVWVLLQIQEKFVISKSMPWLILRTIDLLTANGIHRLCSECYAYS